MKSVFRFIGAGALAVAFTAIGATNSFAQDVCTNVEANQADYKVFTDNYPKTDIPGRKSALAAAKAYNEKYANCPDYKAQVDYLKSYIPAAEKTINEIEEDIAAQARYARFNNALKAKNWDELYPAGQAVLEKEKDPTTALDITIVLGQIGLDESSEKNNDKYNADTVRYAQEAIKKIESGVTSKSYGVAVPGSVYVFANKNFPDTKANALGWLNYIIGYIKYTREKNPKDALPYLYQATQIKSGAQQLPNIYQGIGSYYFDEMVKLEEKRQALLKTTNNVDNDETKAIFALQKGYADRSVDGYARAYNLVGADPKQKAYKDGLYARLKTAYEFRNNGKTDGIDAAISSVKSKPLVNPATEVTPVVEAAPTEPATTNTTGSTATAPATKPAATTPATKPATKPAVTPATKPVSGKTATEKTAPATTTTAKAPVKKPAPKKKGTR